MCGHRPPNAHMWAHIRPCGPTHAYVGPHMRPCAGVGATRPRTHTYTCVGPPAHVRAHVRVRGPTCAHMCAMDGPLGHPSPTFGPLSQRTCIRTQSSIVFVCTYAARVGRRCTPAKRYVAVATSRSECFGAGPTLRRGR